MSDELKSPIDDLEYKCSWYPFRPDFIKGTRLKHYTFTKREFDTYGVKRIKEILDKHGFKYPVFLKTITYFGYIWYDYIMEDK